jgi:SAM-dependent methyltransferase
MSKNPAGCSRIDYLRTLETVFFRDEPYFRRDPKPGNEKHPHLYTSPEDVACLIDHIPGHLMGGRALDVGCGKGYVMACLASKGFRTYGIEVDGRAIEKFEAVMRGFPLDPVPLVMKGDYSKLGGWETFGDGAGFRDMDVIYCYPGDHGDAMEFLRFIKRLDLTPGILCLNSPSFLDYRQRCMMDEGFQRVPQMPFIERSRPGRASSRARSPGWSGRWYTCLESR